MTTPPIHADRPLRAIIARSAALRHHGRPATPRPHAIHGYQAPAPSVVLKSPEGPR